MFKKLEMKTKVTEFEFVDILVISELDLKILLLHITNDILLLACRGVDQSIIDRIAGQLPTLGSEYFLKDLSMTTEMRLEDQEYARNKIEEVFRSLCSEGVIQNWPLKLVS